jgi:enoyl-CoA hydratase
MDHGLELALAGDLRIAVASARFGLTDLARGRNSFPWDGGTQRLPRVVGLALAQDMLLTSRILDAAQALDLGLVNRVVAAGQLMVEARRWADGILAGGPIAARYAKEAMRKGMDLSLPQGLALEADLNVILQSTSDRAEGIQAFLQRRAPRFTGG